MAWKAKLKSIPPTTEISDSFYAEVEYYDPETSRSFTQAFKFVAGNATTLESAQAQVAQKVADLNALDETKALLIPYIGQDVA